jgi:hypothetical protein
VLVLLFIKYCSPSVSLLEALAPYWSVCPGLRDALFRANRPGYVDLTVEKSAIKATIYEHHFDRWRKEHAPRLKALEPGAEKPLVKFRLLIGKTLPDALADRDAAALQFQHHDGDSVYIKDQIRPPLAVSGECHFFSDGEIVVGRNAPVDQVDRVRGLRRIQFHRHAIAQQAVDGLIISV